jgi:hypothetical protein
VVGGLVGSSIALLPRGRRAQDRAAPEAGVHARAESGGVIERRYIAVHMRECVPLDPITFS